MCNCRSHNRPEITGGNGEVVVFNPFEKRDICLDACIKGEILELWNQGIETLSSCCGHNGTFGNPSVIVNKESAGKAKTIIKEIDTNREWDVQYWDLVSI